MYDVVIRYLARVFIDGISLPATAKGCAELAEALDREDLVPQTFEEVASGKIVSRLGLRTADSTWSILVRSASLDVEYRQPRGADGPGFGEYLVEATGLLTRAQSHIGQRGHRVAAVQEGLLAEMPEPTLDRIAARLLRVPPEFEGRPFEWDWRVTRRILREFGGRSETTNTIASVKRVAGWFNDGEPFDRIQLNTDINTDPRSAEPRFEPDDVRAFFSESAGWHDALEREVLGFAQESHDVP